MNATMTQNVAETIISQLGGRRFQVMTGAKDFVSSRFGVVFSICGGRKVRVLLADNDTYSMEVFRLRGVNLRQIASASDVYCENLGDVFTSLTGLETSL